MYGNRGAFGRFEGWFNAKCDILFVYKGFGRVRPDPRRVAGRDGSQFMFNFRHLSMPGNRFVLQGTPLPFPRRWSSPRLRGAEGRPAQVTSTVFVNHGRSRTGFVHARPNPKCASVSAARPCWSVVEFLQGISRAVVLALAMLCFAWSASASNLPLYIVVDLSAGSSAASYPVTYLAAPPSGGFNVDAYKTTKLALRRIDPGTFTMCGQYQTTLTKPYYMGVFEVTQKQYELIMGSNPSQYTGDMRPVEKVSYEMIRGVTRGSQWPSTASVDADSFMGIMRARTGMDFDLPTEAQWENACRAGTTSTYNNGGNDEADLQAVGRYSGDNSDGKGGYLDRHTTVGSYLPNAWGLYDMHGNVWEWCLDWFGELTSPLADPKGASTGTNRVDRGGSWYSDAVRCASSYRGGEGYWPSNGRNNVGFRICLPLSCPSILAEGDLVEGVAIRLGGAPDGWTLHYTTDGSEPTAASPAYTGPFTLAESATVTRNVLCRQGFRVCRQGFGIPICRPD